MHHYYIYILHFPTPHNAESSASENTSANILRGDFSISQSCETVAPAVGQPVFQVPTWKCSWNLYCCKTKLVSLMGIWLDHKKFVPSNANVLLHLTVFPHWNGTRKITKCRLLEDLWHPSYTKNFSPVTPAKPWIACPSAHPCFFRRQVTRSNRPRLHFPDMSTPLTSNHGGL